MRESLLTKWRISVFLTLFLAFGTFAKADALKANNDDYYAVSGANTFDVTLNDQGAVSSISSYESLSIEGGTVSLSGATSLVYTPPVNYFGYDEFNYTITDGSGNFSTAKVRININKPFDITAARNQILAGGVNLADPVGVGYMVTYGPTAYSAGNFLNDDNTNPLIAIGTIGNGRVMALNDHQFLNINDYGNTLNMGAFYLNSIAWLTDTTSKNVRIGILGTNGKTWLNAQGYNNVITNYNGNFSDIDILIGWPGNNYSDARIAATVNFARAGGALMLCDTGIGYDWWWNKDTPDMPTNKILINAGIGLTKEIYGPMTAVTPATGQMSHKDVLNVLRNLSSYSTAVKNQAGRVMGRMYLVLPAGHSLQAELDVEFNKIITTINPTPQSTVSDAFRKAFLIRECQILLDTPVEQTVAHRTAETVWGKIPEGAERVTKTLSFNVNQAGKDTRGNDSVIWLSTGLYAVPGEVITVTTSSPITNRGMKVQISGDWNNITSARDTWHRMPFGTSREFTITSGTTLAASAFGGPVYIVVPANVTPGSFSVTIANAIEMPYFIRGVHTNEDWNNIIRHKPAPYVEFDCGNVIITMQRTQVANLDDAEALVNFWYTGNHAQDELAGLVGRRTRPSRMYNMIQTAWGGGYASYPIGAWGWNFGDLPRLLAGEVWGAYHELGHRHQSNYWTDGRTGEVTVNIFTVVAMEAACDPSHYNAHLDPAERLKKYQKMLSDGGFNGTGLFERLAMYLQLRATFGWDAYKAVFQSYHNDIANNPSALPTTDQQEWDQFMTRFSRQVGYDLSPFFVKWSFGASQTAINSLSDLPKWNMVEVISEKTATPVNTMVVLPDVLAKAYSLDGVKSLVGFTQPVNGTLTQVGSSYRYTPNANFRGLEVLEFTVRNGFNNNFKGTVEILVGHGVDRQVWNNISGNRVSDLTSNSRYPNSPSSTSIVNDFRGPTNVADNYGARYMAYLVPKTSGYYTFWIASDDYSELYLSIDDSIEKTVKIAELVGWTSVDNFTANNSQKSSSIYLEAGKFYFIAALHKEGSGGDHLSVAWQGPDSTTRTVIQGHFLIPFSANPDIPLYISTNLNGFALIANYWLADDCTADNQWCQGSDINVDGRVDIDDLVLLLNNWLE